MPGQFNKSIGVTSFSLALLCPAAVFADGFVVSKIYDPYVQPLETEIEWRLLDQRDDSLPDLQRQWLGFGRSISDRWSAELYVIASKGSGESLSVSAYELEAKWQLTEQGEFAVDWGLLFEVERETENNGWEFTTELLAVRDLGRTTITANLGLIYETGERINSEFETTFRLQARYRWKELLEPSIELHTGQDTTALGPSLSGLLRVGDGKKLRWELGMFAGISERSPDQILKANLEFEF